MRTPLNRTHVNSLLLHLPQRANFSQPLHLRDNDISRLLHLPLLGKPRDSEPNRRVREFIRHAQRPHHIRRLQRRARARRPRGHRDIRHGHNQRLALHARERQIHVARPPMLAIPVQRHIRKLRLAPLLQPHFALDPIDEPVRHALDPLQIALHFLLAQLRRLAQALHRTPNALLPPPAAWAACPSDSRAPARRRTSAARGGRAACGGCRARRRPWDRSTCVPRWTSGRCSSRPRPGAAGEKGKRGTHLAEHLGAVGVEVDTVLAADGADLFQRLDHADLVVDAHDGNEAGLVRDRVLQVVQVDETVLLNREIGHVEAALREPTAAV